jgi:hypothetical protein
MAMHIKMPRLFGGGNDEPVLSQDSAQLVQQLHGSNLAAALAGQVFMQSTTPLGLALPVYTATTLGDANIGGVPIWNPTGSGVNVVLIRFATAKASGTSAFMAQGMVVRLNVGSDLAGGSQITAFAATTPKNAILGGGNASKVKSSNAGNCTITAAGAGDAFTSFFGTGIAADATTGGLEGLIHDFDGTVIVPPGTLIYAAATKTAVAKQWSTIIWKEVPIKRAN